MPWSENAIDIHGIEFKWSWQVVENMDAFIIQPVILSLS